MESLVLFDTALARFALSGTLITCSLVAGVVARRTGRVPSALHSPRWTYPLIFVSMTAFYLLIGPTGGALAGGWLNVLGIALAGLSYAIRWATGLRYPDLVSRSLFYVALPIAVGVPWGLAVLSLPACVASVYCYRHAERMKPNPLPNGEGPLPRSRLFRGIW